MRGEEIIEQEPMKEEERPKHCVGGKHIVDIADLAATACTAAVAAAKTEEKVAVDTLILRRLLLRIRHHDTRHLELPFPPPPQMSKTAASSRFLLSLCLRG